MTLQELIEFYNVKNEHYNVSDDFMKAGYRQEKGGYIEKAKGQNLDVDFNKAKPDQKWHFICSYGCDHSTNKTIPASTAYNSFSCPELKMWMAEAAGVKEEIVKEVSEITKSIMECYRKNRPFDEPNHKKIERFLEDHKICITDKKRTEITAYLNEIHEKRQVDVLKVILNAILPWYIIEEAIESTV